MEKLSKGLLSPKILDTMSYDEKRRYLNELYRCCMYAKVTESRPLYPEIGQKSVTTVGKVMRNFDLEIRGKSNLLGISNAIFVSNHSNSNDFFVVSDLCSRLNIPINILVGSDCLNWLSKCIFKFGNAVAIDRNSKESSKSGLMSLGGRVLAGESAWIFGEATWNIHPEKEMHRLKAGASMLAASIKAPIIPVNIEYVENENFSDSSNLFDKCIITIGQPLFINGDYSILEQNDLIYNSLVNGRRKLWNELGIIKDINNPEYVKRYIQKMICIKYSTGFEYDSKYEEQFLLGHPDNEFTLNDEGLLVPGYTVRARRKKNTQIYLPK